MIRAGWITGLCLLLVACGDAPTVSPLAPGATVLAFGDSLTRGTGAPAGSGYPEALGRMTGLRVIGEGIPGEVSSRGRSVSQPVRNVVRRSWSSCAVAMTPCGICLRPKWENLQAMVAAIRAADADVVMLGVPERNLTLSAPAFYADVAEDLGVPIDLETLPGLMRDRSVKSDPCILTRRVIGEWQKACAISCGCRCALAREREAPPRMRPRPPRAGQAPLRAQRCLLRTQFEAAAAHVSMHAEQHAVGRSAGSRRPPRRGRSDERRSRSCARCVCSHAGARLALCRRVVRHVHDDLLEPFEDQQRVCRREQLRRVQDVAFVARGLDLDSAHTVHETCSKPGGCAHHLAHFEDAVVDEALQTVAHAPDSGARLIVDSPGAGGSRRPLCTRVRLRCGGKGMQARVPEALALCESNPYTRPHHLAST